MENKEDKKNEITRQQKERHLIREALSKRTVTYDTNGFDPISTITGYIGSTIMKGINAACQNFERKRVNILQVTNKTDWYMSGTGFNTLYGATAKEKYAVISSVSALPALIYPDTTVDAIYTKNIEDYKKKGIVYQFIEMSSKDGKDIWEIELTIDMVKLTDSEKPSMKIKMKNNKEDIFQHTAKYLQESGLINAKGTPFAIAMQVNIGATSFTIIEMKDPV